MSFSKKSKSKAPLIGTVFSSDSSSDDYRASNTSANEPKSAPVSLRVFRGSHGGKTAGTVANVTVTPRTSFEQPPPGDADIDDGYVVVEKTKMGSIKPSTLVQYEKNDGKRIKNKYFKKFDTISNTVVLGFYKKHDRRNYSESLDNIKTFMIQRTNAAGENPLQDAIEIPKDQWKSIRRDMLISYEKVDHVFIYRSKFNSFLKGADGTSRMSLTGETGFNYIANPDKILKIYRHISSNDKTLSYILESIKRLELRVRQLEQKK